MAFFSCKKNAFEDPALTGKWKMIEVRDNANNRLNTKPASVSENVEMVLNYSASGKGKMTGNTTTTPVRGDFTVGEQKTFSMPLVYNDIDKVAFDIFWGSEEWDTAFLNNITLSKEYMFEPNGKLDLVTNNNKTMIFVKE